MHLISVKKHLPPIKTAVTLVWNSTSLISTCRFSYKAYNLSYLTYNLPYNRIYSRRLSSWLTRFDKIVDMDSSIWSNQACMYTCETAASLRWWNSLIKYLHILSLVNSILWRSSIILCISTLQMDDSNNADDLNSSKATLVIWKWTAPLWDNLLANMRYFHSVPTLSSYLVDKYGWATMALNNNTTPNIDLCYSCACRVFHLSHQNQAFSHDSVPKRSYGRSNCM